MRKVCNNSIPTLVLLILIAKTCLALVQLDDQMALPPMELSQSAEIDVRINRLGRKLQAEGPGNPEGPWPECVGKTGNECKEYIQSQSNDLVQNVFIAYPRKFNYYRVWVEVDENGLVSSAPGRG
mmetsp:Transcript_16079/g.22902  ORF Transcript_16079/g.22902 Transcript_16079/m.22902 type:complete len:125 (+) Transcript_16079:36-410(+)